MQKILKVQGVSKKFGQLKAIDDISFEVDEKAIFGIAGPNGAGKTTLFNIISGVPYRADSGKIIFNGNNIQTIRPHKICRLGLARTFQRETAFDSLSVTENILLSARFGGPMDKTELAEASRRVLEEVDLGSVSLRDAGNLSLFEKKRLMLATALVTGPSLLLLDEPASGLTQDEIDYFITLLRRLNAQGLTIVLIEHVLPLLLSLSQRLMIIDYGQKLIEDVPEKVVKDQRVIEAYLGGGCVEL